ncbi:TonB-dependent receptor [Novosphingobium album (ex Hu et al. 2023)]|uniref:TonB-dependent receptor n=1 Tax=Novosphingobium album (ex Hu et al. 2023) TaxID=2930093 RepID=A0ABT0AYD5_9SPHN|nr:TonB-dependent receptor [Novosphingobium album (ex Hu et al. 2023)]MCJ2177691.1 TonB-dependent receptor [Novosphingobium album (ex Hu et al. 2023)]
MSLRKEIPAVRTSSCLAIAAALIATTPAQAQDAPGQSGDATLENGAIVVTGYRASLENAINKKKMAEQIVESVSAEDIGKLPDASIAESIARLPGLTSQRVSGRSNSISIRGLAPDFSTTLLNGREQTSTGDNRAVEYDQYPSEVISAVNVYKTPMASLIGQGLSGTVDMRTIRPLEAGKRIVSVGARGSYADLGKLNAKSDDMGYRINGMYVDQFANDTIGITLGASYTDEPYQIQEFNAWGYPQTDAGDYVIGGSKSYNTSTKLKRLGLNGTLEWRPDPRFTSTIDAFYSNFKDDQIKRGIELPLYWSSATLQDGYTATDGMVTQGTYDGVKGVVRNDVFQRHAKLYSFGWNNEWKGDDGWNAMLDISHSRTDRNELTVESYSGTGRGDTGATDTIGFTSGGSGTNFTHGLDYGDYNSILLTSPQGWGGTQIATDGTTILGGQDGYYNNRIVKDKLWQYHIEVSRDLENSFFSSIQAGWNYTDRSKSLVPDEYFLGLTANTDGTTSVAIPEAYQLGTTNLKYLGLGPVVSYDPLALLKDGIYQLVPNPYGDVVVKSYSISEKLMTGYLQANIRSMIGSAELTGNIGVQAILTDQNSTGASAVYLGTNDNGSPNVGSLIRHASTKYTDILPSLNLSLRFPNDFVIRFAAARETIRPRLDDMRASVSYDYSRVGDVAYVTGKSGNPDLRPWRANAVDLTFEKYFGAKGYIAAQFFYKDLKSYIYTAIEEVPVEGLALSSPGDGVTVAPTGLITIPVNGQGGSLYGVEVAGTLPFEAFTSALSGFGITGSASYTDTSIHPTPTTPTGDLPGYSKWVVNGTAYFEKAGFNARSSLRYRSSFMGEVSGFAANRVLRRAQSEAIVDAQIGYDFQPGSSLEGLSLYIQGQNLTDEPFVTTAPGDSRQIIDYQSYGRRFLAGFTYKF